MAIRVIASSKNFRAEQSLRNLVRNTHKGISHAFNRIGRDISGEAKRTIREDPKTGVIREVKDPFTGELQLHQASAPGESPANLSGALAGSIGAIAQNNQLQIGAGGNVVGNIFMMDIVTFVDYAAELELEFERPYLKPSIDRKQRNTRTYLSNHLRLSLEGE